MDDSFHDLETELKALRPRRPDAQLVANIRRDLATGPDIAAPARPHYVTATNLSSWKWFGWSSAGLATALAVALALTWLGTRPASPPIPTAPSPTLVATVPTVKASPAISSRDDRYQPVAAANVLYDLKDEGPVYVDGNTPARRLRYRYLDTYTWKNSRGNASLKWSVPRDEIRVLPASMN